jgi:hypothetical protein
MEDIIRFSLISARHEPIADSQLAFSHSNCRRRRRMATRASSDGNVLNSQPGVVFFPFRRFDSRPVHASLQILSIVETCRRLQIPIRDYLTAILPGLADLPVSRVAELTPTACAARS